jgi:hypothetical protein
MARSDETDGTVQQRVHDVEVLFARNAKDELDSLVFQALDEQLSGFHVFLVCVVLIGRL